jgi:hypothetical protein
MSVKFISESIGFDGQFFFCRRCGKAGYTKMAQVRGHLSVCPGTAIRKGALPSDSNPLVTHSLSRRDGGLGGQVLPSGLSPLNQPSNLGSSYPPSGSSPPALGYGYEQLDHRIAMLENEYNHLLYRNNAPAVSSGDWLNQNKSWLIMVVVGLALVWVVGRSFQSNCNVAGTGDAKRTNRIEQLGEKAAGKFADRLVTKAADSLFR